jgi:hypothetical protein
MTIGSVPRRSLHVGNQGGDEPDDAPAEHQAINATNHEKSVSTDAPIGSTPILPPGHTYSSAQAGRFHRPIANCRLVVVRGVVAPVTAKGSECGEVSEVAQVSLAAGLAAAAPPLTLPSQTRCDTNATRRIEISHGASREHMPSRWQQRPQAELKPEALAFRRIDI